MSRATPQATRLLVTVDAATLGAARAVMRHVERAAGVTRLSTNGSAVWANVSNASNVSTWVDAPYSLYDVAGRALGVNSTDILLQYNPRARPPPTPSAQAHSHPMWCHVHLDFGTKRALCRSAQAIAD